MHVINKSDDALHPSQQFFSHNVTFPGMFRALDKLYFLESTVLVHFLKKGVTRKFLEY